MRGEDRSGDGGCWVGWRRGEKRGGPSPSLGHSCANQITLNLPRVGGDFPIQGMRNRRLGKPRGTQLVRGWANFWVRVWLQSPFSCNILQGFLGKKPGRGTGANHLPPSPTSTAVHPICSAFSPFPDLSSNYHHFLQLSQVILILAESWVTSSGSSSEGKHFGTACASSQVLRASMIHASCRGSFMQTQRWCPGMTGWAVFSWIYNY